MRVYILNEEEPNTKGNNGGGRVDGESNILVFKWRWDRLP